MNDNASPAAPLVTALGDLMTPVFYQIVCSDCLIVAVRDHTVGSFHAALGSFADAGWKRTAEGRAVCPTCATRHADARPISVRLAQFGRDHWSAFAYIETRCVDHSGVPDRDHMRTDRDRQPGLAGDRIPRAIDGASYPTRLRGGASLHDHDDWDCLADASVEGLLEIDGTGTNPVYRLTEAGLRVAAALRAHKAGGGSFATFVLESVPPA